MNINYDANGHIIIPNPYVPFVDPTTGKMMDFATFVWWANIQNTFADLNNAYHAGGGDPNQQVIGYVVPNPYNVTPIVDTYVPPPPQPQPDPPPPPPPPPPPVTTNTTYVYTTGDGNFVNAINSLKWDIVSWIDASTGVGDSAGGWRSDPTSGTVYHPDGQPRNGYGNGNVDPQLNCMQGTNWGYPYSTLAKNSAFRNFDGQSSTDSRLWNNVPSANYSATVDLTNCTTTLNFHILTDRPYVPNGGDVTVTIQSYPYDIYLKSVTPVGDGTNGLNMYDHIALDNPDGVIVYYAAGGSVTQSQSSIPVNLNLTVRDANYPNMTLAFEFVDSRGISIIHHSADPIIQINTGDLAGVIKVLVPSVNGASGYYNGHNSDNGYYVPPICVFGYENLDWYTWSSDPGMFDVAGIHPLVPVAIYYDTSW